MLSPRPRAPRSFTPATSVENLTHLVQWMHLVIFVLINGPIDFSSTALLFSKKRVLSEPNDIAWSCKSHSPPWSHIGQSKGWLIKRNSITPLRASWTIFEFVEIICPLVAGNAQLAWGFGGPGLTSTKHILQFPAIESLSW